MAATGTPTPNIGLRCPVGTDPASVDDINYNSGVIDTKLGAVGSTSVQAQIDALNSKFTNILSTCTAIPDKSHFGSINRTIRTGNVVQVSAVVVLDDDIASLESIITLPYQAEVGGLYVSGWVDGTNEYKFLTIYGTDLQSYVSLSAGSVIRLAFTYICKP